ncbi:ATP-dependent helicase HrpB [Aristophania vespae]|uniref:ATP-dependent helicase HrpB n=1 Tax=Aristophania vespae TaxID=2697033 RepID=UPI002351C165|nr:ATP-dependent helicase HrpB [Aristophania vespae]UMM63751.1 ATP-dependent RNA helicase HrpB [Aristophania vespae]
MLTESSLPVEETLPALLKSLQTNPNLVLMAPPGAGKTTLVPPYLLAHEPNWLAGKKIILVEPRRVAVRGAAARMAFLRGEDPGEFIGYCTRLEQVVSAKTRIEVMTEGLLLRRLLSNPLLEDVGVVIFDEVHERSLNSDIAIALCLDIQKNFRPDLRIVAMSATLETDVFTELLKAPLLQSQGRQYPVTVRYERDIAHLKDLPALCARVIHRMWNDEAGSILVFLPGIGEIRRCAALLDSKLPVYFLYGEQSPQEQQKALDPEKGRRIVLATSIAETSVTVPGVHIVIDGGWRRSPRRDPNTGLSRLITHRISRATAEQRAGRAGRQGPGIAVRLWSEMTQRRLLLQDSPEIKDADLSDFALITSSWRHVMGTDPLTLPLIEMPPSGALEAAQHLLKLLGALDKNGSLTPLGHKMIGVGTHPRLAAMLCSAETDSEKITASCLAALLEERDPLGRVDDKTNITTDIRLRLALFAQNDRRVPGYVMQHLRHIAKRYMRRLKVKDTDFSLIEDEKIPFLVAAGFPDRVAQQAGDIGRYRLAGGGSARLSVTDPLSRESLLVAIGIHAKRSHEITMATALKRDDLPSCLQQQLVEKRDLAFDTNSGRVWARQKLCLGSLVLKDKNIPASEEEALELFLERLKSDFKKLLTWDDKVCQLQARIHLARLYFAPDLPDLSDEALLQDLEWLKPWLVGFCKLSQFKELDLTHILQSFLSYEERQILDKHLPPFLTLKGRQHTIDYTAPVPSVSARAQSFYGLKSLPIIARGKVSLQAILLSPAGRPQAITTDLEAFWKNGWLDLLKEMRGRYPKHNWPEDPSSIIS